jgi:hypothetical protein
MSVCAIPAVDGAASAADNKAKCKSVRFMIILLGDAALFGPGNAVLMKKTPVIRLSS